MSTKFKIRKSTLKTKIEDTLVILNTDSGKYIELNPSASFIFEQIEKGMNVEEIEEEITKIYEVKRELVTSDLNTFIKEATKVGIIREINK